MSKAAFLLFLLVLFPVVGGGVIFSSLGMLNSALSASHWPTVQGEVLSSRVVKEQVYSRSGPVNSRRKPTDMYSAQVQYEYVVGDATYRNERIALQDGASSDRHQAELTAEKFLPGPVTVYYNPQDPQDALLAPEDVSSIVSGLVIGGLTMVVPPALILLGLRYEYIERPELPLVLRLWWSQRFGKLKDADGSAPPPGPAAIEEPPSSERSSEGRIVPNDKDFIESVASWDFKNRVELTSKPPAMWIYAMVSVVIGVIVAWAGMIPATTLIYQRDTLHLPEVRTVSGVLFAISGSLAFFTMRLWDRGSRTVLNWNSREIQQKREFSRMRRFEMTEVRQITVRCIPVEGRRRKFRAAIDLGLHGECITIARTCEPRRKQESAREKAAALAEPLAAALDVPVNFEGWTDD